MVMKRLVCYMAATLLLILLVMPAPVQAASIPTNEVAIYYNGERQAVNAWLKDGTALLPLRDVCNLFNIAVDYSAQERKVRLYNDENFYVFDLKTGQVLLNGEQAMPLPITPQMRNDKLYLPLRYVGELLDVQVIWHEADRRIELLERPITMLIDENGVLTAVKANWGSVKEPLALAIPSGVVEIGEMAFSGAKIDEIEMADAAGTLKKIGPWAFYSTKLQSAIIPDSVQEIDGCAFNACWDLLEIKLPAELKVLRQEVFAETNLRRLVVPQKVEVIEANIFNLHPRHMSPHYTPIELVVLPPGVKQINDDAFAYCYDLVLEGLAGSYAEEYAKSCGLTFKVISEQELAAYYK